MSVITVLCGGVGAARFLRGLVRVVNPADITAIVNTGDDFTLHGLRICPDIDTIRYSLSGDVGTQGWGRSGETWRAMEALGELSPPDGSRATPWFSLGDRDLATHLYRSQRLSEGASLSTVTAELASAAGLTVRMLPMSEEPVPTMLTLETGEVVDFQEYFVGRQHAVGVESVEYRNAANVCPHEAALDAIRTAERVIIAPSNPIASVGPLLALPALAAAVTARRARCVAVSPIVGGAAIKGPAVRMMSELGHEPNVVGVASMWADVCSKLVIDEADSDLAASVRAHGVEPVVTRTLMTDDAAAADLARVVLAS